MKNATMRTIYDDTEFLFQLKEKKIQFHQDENGLIHLDQNFEFPLEFRGKEYREIDCRSLAACSGNLSIPYAWGINLPALNECGNLYIESCSRAKFSSLKKCGNLKFEEADELDLNSLVECGNIDVERGYIEFSALKECKNLKIGSFAHCGFPALEKCNDIDLMSDDNLEMPNLIEARNIGSSSTRKAILPALKKCNRLWVTNASELEISSLEECASFDLCRNKYFNISKDLIVGRTYYRTFGIFNTNTKSILLNGNKIKKFIPIEESDKLKFSEGSYGEGEKAFTEFCKLYTPDTDISSGFGKFYISALTQS